MEFGILRGIIDTKSYLGQDDLNWPGDKSFKKLTGVSDIDFALFKISTYALSEKTLERAKFASELAATFEQLGHQAADYVEPLLQSVV